MFPAADVHVLGTVMHDVLRQASERAPGPAAYAGSDWSVIWQASVALHVSLILRMSCRTNLGPSAHATDQHCCAEDFKCDYT